MKREQEELDPVEPAKKRTRKPHERDAVAKVAKKAAIKYVTTSHIPRCWTVVSFGEADDCHEVYNVMWVEKTTNAQKQVIMESFHILQVLESPKVYDRLYTDSFMTFLATGILEDIDYDDYGAPAWTQVIGKKRFDTIQEMYRPGNNDQRLSVFRKNPHDNYLTFQPSDGTPTGCRFVPLNFDGPVFFIHNFD